MAAGASACHVGPSWPDGVGVCAQGRRCAPRDQQREQEQRDPRHSGWAARQGAQVKLGATGDEEDGDEESISERIEFRAEDRVARGIAVHEVEHDPGEEGAEDGLQSYPRREGHEADEKGDGYAHADLGGRVLQPGEEGIQPYVPARAAEGHPGRGNHDTEDPERDDFGGGPALGLRRDKRKQGDRTKLPDGRTRDYQLAQRGFR